VIADREDKSMPSLVRRGATTVLTLLGVAGTAHAHVGGHVSPDRWWAGWNVDPAILVSLGLVAVLYARGLRRLWRAGAGRAVSRWRAAAFAAGMLALVAALVSPVDALSDELSWVHMVQHMLLMNVAAPLMVLGAPALVLLSGVPGRYRSAIGRAWRRIDAAGLWNPAVVFVLFAVVLWVWHWPALYLAALRDPVVHDLEHLTFFVAAVLFWRLVLDPVSRRRLNPIGGVVYLFATSLHTMALGVFMTLAARPWYTDYRGRTAAWGLTVLEDQQLAGAVMWMPGGLVYAVAAAARLAALLEAEE
jgi:putative membrane protein